jgi:hypothetical protein
MLVGVRLLDGVRLLEGVRGPVFLRWQAGMR